METNRIGVDIRPLGLWDKYQHGEWLIYTIIQWSLLYLFSLYSVI